MIFFFKVKIKWLQQINENTKFSIWRCNFNKKREKKFFGMLTFSFLSKESNSNGLTLEFNEGWKEKKVSLINFFFFFHFGLEDTRRKLSRSIGFNPTKISSRCFSQHKLINKKKDFVRFTTDWQLPCCFQTWTCLRRLNWRNVKEKR